MQRLHVAPLILLVASLAFPTAIAFGVTPAGAAQAGAPASDAAVANNKPAADPVARQMMARVEQRIATLHAELQITSAQETQWQQFAQVMRDNAQKMEQNAGDRAEKFSSLNAVENMKSYAQMAVEHGQYVQKLAAAFENVYNVMSPEQKKRADEVFRSREERRQQRHRGQ